MTDLLAFNSLMPLVSGYYYSWALFAAVRLELPDLLTREPMALADVAARCGAEAVALEKLLEALDVLGVVAASPGGRYAATDVSDWLRRDVDGGLREMALLGGERCLVEAWAGLEEAVRTGITAFEAVHGQPFFEYLDARPALRARFQRAWRGPRHWNEAMAGAYDFGRHRRLVDVGGGWGGLTRAIIDRYPSLEAVVFDREPVTGDALEDGAETPFERVAGDFMAGVPGGADAYVLRYVLHDWDDERAATILDHCAAAMSDGGRVLIYELLHEPGQHSPAALLGLSMLVLTGGEERSVDGYRALLQRAGLELVAVHGTSVGTSLLEAAARKGS